MAVAAAEAAIEIADAIGEAETVPQIIGNVTKVGSKYSSALTAAGSVVTAGATGYYAYKQGQTDNLKDELYKSEINELQNATPKPNPVAMNISNPYALPTSYLPMPIQPAPLQSAVQNGYSGSGIQ